MPKQISKMNKRLKYVRENWDFKYVEPNVRNIMIEKKKQEEYDAEIKKQEDLWKQYFGFDGTCLSHDRIGCAECKVPATGRCYSSLEE